MRVPVRARTRRKRHVGDGVRLVEVDLVEVDVADEFVGGAFGGAVAAFGLGGGDVDHGHVGQGSLVDVYYTSKFQRIRVDLVSIEGAINEKYVAYTSVKWGRCNRGLSRTHINYSTVK